MRHDISQLLKLLGCSVLVAYLMQKWATLPVLDVLSLAAWHSIALLLAMVVGAVWEMWTGSWFRTLIAVLVGFIGGVVWLDFRTLRDTSPFHPTLGSVIELIVSSWDEMVMVLISAGIGVLGMRMFARLANRLVQNRGDA